MSVIKDNLMVFWVAISLFLSIFNLINQFNTKNKYIKHSQKILQLVLKITSDYLSQQSNSDNINRDEIISMLQDKLLILDNLKISKFPESHLQSYVTTRNLLVSCIAQISNASESSNSIQSILKNYDNKLQHLQATLLN